MAFFATISLATEPQRSVVPNEGILILRNGYVLSGRITPQGDNYLVTLGDSGEVRLPAQQVELICASLEEAYFIKRDRINRFDLRGRLELADWCLSQKLYARAADQLLCVMLIDVTDPRIRILSRRLRNAALERQLDGQASEPTDRVKAAEQSEQLLASLPSGAVESYTEAVQPVLLNRCATNACHGSGSKSDFRLLRPHTGRTLTHRMTQRNLSMTLKYVSPQSPQESPLLTKPTSAHGGLDQAVFDDTQSEQLGALVRWVRNISGARKGTPQRVAKPDTVLSQAQSSGFDWQDPASELRGEDPKRSRTLEPPVEAKPLGDPFDPDVFNRRYFPNKQRE